MGCAHALNVVANVLLDAHISNESLAIGEYDVRRAFDSGIHAQIMLELRKNGVDPAIVRPLYDLYRQLNVCLRIPNAELTRKIPVKKVLNRVRFLRQSCLLIVFPRRSPKSLQAVF